jgi:hypothetical protein
LRLDSEDSLLDFILELGHDYFDLLGSVSTEYLSVSGIDRLLDSISLEEVDCELWSSLCSRLRLRVQLSSVPTARLGARRFEFDPRRPFDGVFAQFTWECGGNVHTKGIISITASSHGMNDPHEVVDYNSSEYWTSRNEANSWLQFDFKSRRIALTNYSIKSKGGSQSHLLEWSVEASNDATSWTVLDRRKTQDLNGNCLVSSYECESQRPPQLTFRFIRLIQTGPNSQGGNVMGLSIVEFFGVVTELEAA